MPGRRGGDKEGDTPEELWLVSQGQIDFYDDRSLITPAADAVAAFLPRSELASTRRD
jgi:hypothetical protein